jgi:hypothetical protein
VKAPPRGALPAKLRPRCTEFEQAAARAHALPAHANAQFAADPMSYPLRRIALDWKPPAFAPPVQWSSPPKEEELRDATVEFSWAGEAARHVGTVVHRLLQRMADEGLEAWEGRRVDEMDDVLSRR